MSPFHFTSLSFPAESQKSSHFSLTYFNLSFLLIPSHAVTPFPFAFLPSSLRWYVCLHLGKNCITSNRKLLTVVVYARVQKAARSLWVLGFQFMLSRHFIKSYPAIILWQERQLLHFWQALQIYWEINVRAHQVICIPSTCKVYTRTTLMRQSLKNMVCFCAICVTYLKQS